LQARVAAHLQSRHGGVLPQPQFMEEGNWIAMTRVPLITTEGAATEGGTTADAEGGGADVQRDDARGTEGVSRQDAEATHGNEAEGIARTAETPSNDAERAVMTVGTAMAVCTSPEAATTPDGDAVPAPDEGAHATTSTGGALEVMQRKGRMQPSLKPRCLSPAPLSAKPPPPRARGRRADRSSARHHRCRGLRGLELMFSKQIVFFGDVVVIDTNAGCLCAGSLGGACVENRRCERPAPAHELFFLLHQTC
jgi:hypothetical protein